MLRVSIASVPSTMPAMMEPRHSGSGLPKWIMQYGIIIAMTALCRMIILQSKDIDPVNILFEAGGILILAVAAFVMSMKDKMSLEKLRLRQDAEEREP